MKKTSFVSVRVRIEAQTREQLALAAKEFQIKLDRVKELKGIKNTWFGSGIRKLEVK